MLEMMARLVVDGLKDSFQADGADLELVKVTRDKVKVRIVMGPKTCRECIMDADSVREIIENSLFDEETAGKKIAVEVEVVDHAAL